MKAKEFYIQWCIERNPELEEMIRDCTEGEGYEEIFEIMEEYSQYKINEFCSKATGL